MAKPQPFYLDGYPAPEREVTVIAQPDYPFENYSVPDLYARTLDRVFDVTPNNFTPKIGTRTAYTNYILQSQAFTTTWTTTALTMGAAATANPSNGTVDAFSALETTANSEHYLTQAFTFSSVQNTLSFFIKSNGRTWARVKANDGTTNFTAFFNLATGQTGTAANCTATITFAGNGWYRCAITFTPLAAAGAVFVQPSTDGSTVSYTGNAALGLYVWGAQLERAAFAGPYISTLTVSRAISSPGLDYLRTTSTAQDPGDLFAYLVREQSPQNITSTNAQLRRMFARIPSNQTSYPGSRYIPVPGIPNTFGDGQSFPVLQLDPRTLYIGEGVVNEDVGAIFVNSTQALYYPLVAAGARTAGYATGGTFTLTYGANTTGSLNYNDTGVTIAAALNALASVIADGLTATITTNLTSTSGGYIGVIWSVGGTFNPVTMNVGSLTVTTSQNSASQVGSYTLQTLGLADHIVFSTHGFSAAEDLATLTQLSSTGAYRILINPTGEWGVIDANTLWLPTTGGTSSYIDAAPFSRIYPSGQTFLLRTQVIESFSLPGVTSGITTPADIPTPADIQQNSAFILAVLTQSGYATYQSEGPEPWMGSLIYVIREIQINLSDINGT